MCRDDIRHRRGQPRSGGGGGKLRSGAADRAVSQSALRAAGHRRQPDHGTAGLFRHPGARQHQPGAGRGRTRADLGAQRDLAIGYVPSVGGRHGCSHRQRGPRALRHPLREPLVPDPEPLGAVTPPGRPAGKPWTYTPPVTFDQPLDIDLSVDTVVISGHGAGVHPNLAALPTVAEPTAPRSGTTRCTRWRCRCCALNR